MSPTDSNSLSDHTKSAPTEQHFAKNARTVPASAPKGNTQSAPVETGTTVPSSISPDVVSLRYSPRRVRSGCPDSETQS